MDLNRKEFTAKIGEGDFKIEISKIAGQTNGSAIARYGDTVVLSTVVMGKSDEDRDYMPLSVEYEEKFYSVGKIMGGRFMKREGRPTDGAVLSARLIDRTIRPLFDQRIRRSIQIVNTVLSYDREHDPAFVGLIASSTALGISDIPWKGPVAGVAIAKVGSDFLVNPKLDSLEDNPEVSFESFFAGTESSINMIELAGNETSEEDVITAASKAQAEIKEIVAFQNKIIKEVGKPKADLELKSPSEEFLQNFNSFLGDKLDEAVYVKDKKEQYAGMDKVKAELTTHLEEKASSEEDMQFIDSLFEKALDDTVHKNILESDKRPDGRALDEVRDLHAEVGLLPRTHGSSLFVRGDTQALGTTTLGSPGDRQLIESIKFSGEERFMLHYNFPPYSVGETGRIGGKGRRDIGHGALAQKAILPILPKEEDFPYTIRVVSEILSSNGSSSMATVSAASLSLMDAGVPIKSPAAGIAMGLILGEGGTYKVLTDIQGPEDHYGDMDLKVAGTKGGINAMQMDVKIDGISIDILRDTIKAAEKARLHILDTTDKILSEGRAEVSEHAPKIIITTISPDKIGEVIGPGGKMINSIIERTGVDSIDIKDDGKVFITSTSSAAATEALADVEAAGRDLEVGQVLEGVVGKILEFGAIVDMAGGKSGLLHISEIKDGYTESMDGILKEGDKVKVKVIKTENGKVSLSIKQLEK